MAKQDTRERILSAAIEIFSKKGYEASAVHDIAKKAGVNELTVYRHFKCKDCLFEESLKRFIPLPELSDTLSEKVTGILDKDLELFANTYLNEAIKRKEYIKVLLMEMPKNPKVAKHMSVVPSFLTKKLADYFRGLHEAGQIPSSNFDLIARMFFMNLFQYVIANHVFVGKSHRFAVSREEAVKTFVQVFSGGLGYRDQIKNVNVKGVKWTN